MQLTRIIAISALLVGTNAIKLTDQITDDSDPNGKNTAGAETWED